PEGAGGGLDLALDPDGLAVVAAGVVEQLADGGDRGAAGEEEQGERGEASAGGGQEAHRRLRWGLPGETSVLSCRCPWRTFALPPPSLTSAPLGPHAPRCCRPFRPLPPLVRPVRTPGRGSSAPTPPTAQDCRLRRHLALVERHGGLPGH